MKKTRDFTPRTNLIQYRVLLARYLRQIVTSPWYIVPLILQPVLLLIIISFVYEDGTFYEPWRHVTSAHTTPFLLAFSAALMGLLNSYREICKEREVLGREVFGGVDLVAYLASKITALGIVGLLQSMVITFGSLAFIDYNMSDPARTLFFILLALFLTNYCVTALGLTVSALLKKSESAILPIIVIIVLQVVFAGVLIEFEGAMKLFYFITPSMYGTAVIGNVTGLGPMRQVYQYNEYVCLAMLVVITVVCHVITALKLKHDYRTKD